MERALGPKDFLDAARDPATQADQLDELADSPCSLCARQLPPIGTLALRHLGASFLPLRIPIPNRSYSGRSHQIRTLQLSR